MKIFFSSAMTGEWTSGWQRCQCLRELGYEVCQFDQEPYVASAPLRRSVRLLTGRCYKPRIVREFNRDLLQAVLNARPDAAWLEWPMLLRRETLQQAVARLPNCTWVCFQDDNPFGSRPGEQKRWENFLEAIPCYDLHFVKRQSDVVEFQRRHAKSVRLFRHGFYKGLFRPIPRGEVSVGLRHDVSFVGTPLDRRVSDISELLVGHKVSLHVYGNSWHRTLIYHRRRDCFGPAVLGEDYVRVICGSRISLGFVSSSNRDEYTMRTFEIPACKGFFLAERTPAHQELFVEGQEAEFFDTVEECADKIRFYLKADAERNRIAERGYQRCLKSDYTLHTSMARAVAQIESLGPEPVLN